MLLVEEREKDFDCFTKDEIIAKAYDMKQDLVEEYLPLMHLYFPDFEIKLEKPTTGWLDNFLERQNLKTLKGEAMEDDRKDVATTGTVKLWFEKIFEQCKEIKMQIQCVLLILMKSWQTLVIKVKL